MVQESFQVVTRRMANLRCNAGGISRAPFLHIPLLTKLDGWRMGEYRALASLPTTCTSLGSTMRALKKTNKERVLLARCQGRLISMSVAAIAPMSSSLLDSRLDVHTVEGAKQSLCVIKVISAPRLAFLDEGKKESGNLGAWHDRKGC